MALILSGLDLRRVFGVWVASEVGKDRALLGQNFLSRFNIRLGRDEMVLQAR